MDWMQTVGGQHMADCIVQACLKYTARKEGQLVSKQEFKTNCEDYYKKGWYYVANIDDENILIEKRG